MYYQHVTKAETRKWHYKRVEADHWGESDDHLADPSGSGVEAQGVVDGLLIGFGPIRLADVQGPLVPTREGHRHPLLSFQDVSQRGPTGGVAPLLEVFANDLYELIGG